MKAVLTKSFRFSASSTLRGRALGKNYILEITLDVLDPEKEIDFENKVREHLIGPIHSTDLGETTDQQLLQDLWMKAERAALGCRLSAMTLIRDETARTTFAL